MVFKCLFTMYLFMWMREGPETSQACLKKAPFLEIACRINEWLSNTRMKSKDLFSFFSWEHLVSLRRLRTNREVRNLCITWWADVTIVQAHYCSGVLAVTVIGVERRWEGRCFSSDFSLRVWLMYLHAVLAFMWAPWLGAGEEGGSEVKKQLEKIFSWGLVVVRVRPYH